MKKHEEVIVVPIPFRREWTENDDGSISSKMVMAFADCQANLENDGKEIATLGGYLGAGYEIRIKGEEHSLFASMKDIWNAYCGVVKKPEWVLAEDAENKEK